MHAELTLPLDISIQGRGRRGSRSDGRGARGGMNKPRRKRTYFQQHLGVARSLLRLSFRLSLPLCLRLLNVSTGVLLLSGFFGKGHAVTGAMGSHSLGVPRRRGEDWVTSKLG